MKRNFKYKLPILATVICFFVSFFSLDFILLLNSLDEKTQKVVGYIIAAVFWLFLAAGIACVIWTKSSYILIRKKVTDLGLYKMQKYPGIITFSKDIPNIVIYVITGLGIVLSISDMIFNWISQYLMFPIISITLFLFVLHCIIDGENFKIYKIIKEAYKLWR